MVLHKKLICFFNTVSALNRKDLFECLMPAVIVIELKIGTPE